MGTAKDQDHFHFSLFSWNQILQLPRSPEIIQLRAQTVNWKDKIESQPQWQGCQAEPVITAGLQQGRHLSAPAFPCLFPSHKHKFAFSQWQGDALSRCWGFFCFISLESTGISSLGCSTKAAEGDGGWAGQSSDTFRLWGIKKKYQGNIKYQKYCIDIEI